MPSKPILLLDVDGVLLTPPEWFGVKITQQAPVAGRALFSGPFQAATRGEIDLADSLGPVLQELGRTQSPTEFLDEWHRSEDVRNEPVWELVRQVRPRFERVLLATNQERHRLRHLLDSTRLGSLVDGDVASCTVGCRKPDPAFYAAVQSLLNAPPERLWFVDDSEENVESARQAGWNAHLYAGPEDMVRFLEPTASPTEAGLP
ncbi:MAG: HAD-IA family hydrolase [Fimbriimonadaceae bacterium]|nr:HAD-IA family hydrolase [Fimbriimonadaceae bacterium]